ncbi:MAG: hypothetical protein DDT40_00921 [candidate division WS2 bacterium]|nr:hypothetical protein [Bacillota bacterium]MBT9150742.1 hypothetical protein [Candidatus Psychracetigena formicireducens]
MKASSLKRAIKNSLKGKPFLYRIAKWAFKLMHILHILSDPTRRRELVRKNRVKAHSVIKRFVSEGNIVSILISREDTMLTLDDGRKFYWYPESTNSLLTIPIWGEFEPEETHLISKIINQGDIVFDIGANFGWYTTLLINLVGETGEVHAFEPISTAFSELRRNLELNGKLHCQNLFLNNVGIGDVEKADQSIYLPVEAGSAFSSFARNYYPEGKHIEYKCDVTTLDSYVEKHKVRGVSFIKCDIEGAELLMLNGAKRILSSDIRPMLFLEVADVVTTPFGYKPRDIFMFLQKYRYEFYYLQDDKLNRLSSYDDLPNNINFLCVIPSLHRERLRRIFGG